MENSRCCQRFICKGLGVCGEGLGCMNGDCTITQEKCMCCYLCASASFYMVIEVWLVFFPLPAGFSYFFSLWILESCTLMLACLPFSFLLFLMQLFKWNIYSFQSSFHFNLSLAEILNSFLRMFLHGFLKCLLSWVQDHWVLSYPRWELSCFETSY